MRNTANFHPEWGYLAPAPSFIRTARVVLVATVVGATVGAGVVFSWVSHQGPEPSVGARTLVWPLEAASARANTSAEATQGNAPSLTEKRSLMVTSRSADAATKEASASSTTRPPDGITALAEAPAATEGPSTATIAAPPTAAKEPVLNIAPSKRKATKKSNVTWRFALRDEPAVLRRVSTTREEAGVGTTAMAAGDVMRIGDNRMQPMPVCPGGARLGPFRSCKQFPCTILATEGEHMATSAERMRALRERERRGLSSLPAGFDYADIAVLDWIAAEGRLLGRGLLSTLPSAIDHNAANVNFAPGSRLVWQRG